MVGTTKIFDMDGNIITVVTQDDELQLNCVKLATDVFALIALTPVDGAIKDVVIGVYFCKQDALDIWELLDEGHNSLPLETVSAIDYLIAADKYDDTPRRVRNYLRDNNITAIEYLNEIFSEE